MNEVEQVLAAEKEAAQILEKADRTCQNMLDEARNETVQHIADEQEKSVAWQNEEVAQKKEELAKEKEAILEKARTQADKAEAKAQKKLDTTVDKLLKAFEGLTE